MINNKGINTMLNESIGNNYVPVYKSKKELEVEKIEAIKKAFNLQHGKGKRKKKKRK